MQTVVTLLGTKQFTMKKLPFVILAAILLFGSLGFLRGRDAASDPESLKLRLINDIRIIEKKSKQRCMSWSMRLTGTHYTAGTLTKTI